ncbi:hypothetical protein BCV72DRAFT_322855, partial [Rhizopus microsporus var. microsporus]
LINYIELYNCKPSLNPHYERFGSRYMVGSCPSMNNKYNNVNTMSKVEDKSKKLLIGTLVFNGLVTSSIRLYQIHPTEVGTSTFLFSPTKETKVYVSSGSTEQVNRTISQKLEITNSHDLGSQLRQVRSRLTSPRTYVSSRFSSQ